MQVETIDQDNVPILLHLMHMTNGAREGRNRLPISTYLKFKANPSNTNANANYKGILKRLGNGKEFSIVDVCFVVSCFCTFMPALVG
ncbi:hypothetical protein ACE6H2_008152 [Prunus campanulata]